MIHDGRKLVHRKLLDRARQVVAHSRAPNITNGDEAKAPPSSSQPALTQVALASPKAHDADSAEGQLIDCWSSARREHGFIEPLAGSDAVDAMYRVRLGSRYAFVPRGWRREFFGEEAWRRLATWFEVDEQLGPQGRAATGSIELERIALASNPNAGVPDAKGKLRLAS